MRNGGWFGGEFGMYGLLGRESGLMCGDCVVLNWGFGGGLVEGEWVGLLVGGEVVGWIVERDVEPSCEGYFLFLPYISFQYGYFDVFGLLLFCEFFDLEVPLKFFNELSERFLFL